MSGDNGVQIAVALIGFAGTIGAALITAYAKPRQTPVPQSASQQQGGMRPPETYGSGGSASTASAAAQPAVVTARPKISRSLWWGIAACLCFASFVVAWACALVGTFIAVRDIRSPGARRLAWWGLVLCVLALVIAAANPHSGFMSGFLQGYNQSK